MNLSTWRAAVRGEAQSCWGKPLLQDELKAVILNFYSESKPSLDLDNMSKPILDAMEGIVYRNDRQITQAEFAHRKRFVYVRIEDPVEPFPLPKVNQ